MRILLSGYSIDPASAYERLYRAQPRTFLFESGSPGSSKGRYSLLGSFNNFLIKSFADKMEIGDRGKITKREGNPVSFLQHILDTRSSPARDRSSSFQGGLVGYFGYDLVRFFESFTMQEKAPVPIPDLYFGITDEVIIFDHAKDTISLVINPENGPESKGTEERELEIIRLLRNGSGSLPSKGYSAANLKSTANIDLFGEMVKKAKRYIHEGDIFQANLSHRFEADFTGSSWEFYRKLREINPSPFQGYMNFGDQQLVSASPERLLKIEGSRLETGPIAGTRPRGRTGEHDIRVSNDLILNEKEKAEHLMLVDLERNDLGRVCRYGSVRVEEFMALEAYSHVWHIVSKVTGEKREGVKFEDILRACFPGGTITGCPKVRCMEIIEELEPIRRGLYTGSMGYIGWEGSADLNILIRSAVITGGKIFFHTGSGIVADSDPAAEYRETIDKAQAILEALGLTLT